jgi:hypothetical protein
MQASETRRQARALFTQLVQDDATSESVRNELGDLFEAGLAAQVATLPTHVAETLVAPADGSFDGVHHSLRRHALAGWRSWLERDATMPEAVRAFARLDTDQLDRVVEDAGLVHVAMLAASLDEARRIKLLSGFLSADQSARTTAYMRTPPEPAPRRATIKRRLNAMLSMAEPSGVHGVPRRPGLEAIGSWLASRPDEQREHLRRAWPGAVYNAVLQWDASSEPNWSLDDATWIGLLNGLSMGEEP